MVISAKTHRTTFVQSLRALLACGLILFFSQWIHFDTPVALLCLGAVTGIYLGAIVLTAQISLWRVAFAHILLVVFYYAAYFLANYYFLSPSAPQSSDFIVYQYSQHALLILLFYGVCLAETVLFWCVGAALSGEVILGSSLVIWLLSGHRNYMLDAPKQISAIAWRLGVEPQILLISLGAVAVVLMAAYLYVASKRTLFFNQQSVSHSGQSQLIFSASIILCVALLFGAYGFRVYQQYSAELNRAMNGVGQGGKEGDSPLGFHPSISQTRQPMALIRLETDYAENPYGQMLYLRESAISEYNGKELVIAAQKYDTDIPLIRAGDALTKDSLQQVEGRKEVTQSIYFLAKHQRPFAIDYPVVMRLLKNPDPERFILAYQALSIAPAESLDYTVERKVGSSAWDRETWDHYLRAPGSLDSSKLELSEEQVKSGEPLLDQNQEDLRYKALTSDITAGASTPIEKTAKIIEYLNANSTYTLRPGYQNLKNADPVAPYLFSKEMRGYCVHFSHAAVYLLRLAGIPARIGTGYLIDLNYSKDGHALIQSGDRHAWPEVYLDGYGWVVFDVSPAHVESEQSLVPDEKLLQELMSKIDPIEQLNPPAPIAADGDQQKWVLEVLMSQRSLLLMFSLVLFAWVSLKGLLRFGYCFQRSNRNYVKYAYLAFSSLLTDLGFIRGEGETRYEYAARLGIDQGIDFLSLTNLFEQYAYANQRELSKKETKKSIAQSLQSAKAVIPSYRRLFAFLSLRSLVNYFRL